MSKVREMIEAIACDDFDSARTALKATLADYMAGKVYVSNEDLYGTSYEDDYKNPNVDDELEILADLHGGVVHDPDAHITNKKKKKPEDFEKPELQESVKTLYAVYGDKVDGPVEGKTFKTEADAEKFQDSLWNSPDWTRFASRPRELFVDTYEE